VGVGVPDRGDGLPAGAVATDVRQGEITPRCHLTGERSDDAARALVVGDEMQDGDHQQADRPTEIDQRAYGGVR
jgi:hypothetical protein